MSGCANSESVAAAERIASESELPQGWLRLQIHEVGTVVTGNTPSTLNPANFGDKYPFVRPPDLDQTGAISQTTQYLSEEGVRNARLLPEGSVLVSCIGSLGKVGLAATELATNQQINSIVFDRRVVAPKFGFYYCQTLKRWLTENASATTVSIVNKKRFETAPFVLAPVPEQERIVAEIEKQFTRLDAATAALKRVQANLKRYRASVLKAACEGRLVPTEAELARKEGRDYEPADQLIQRSRTSNFVGLPSGGVSGIACSGMGQVAIRQTAIDLWAH